MALEVHVKVRGGQACGPLVSQVELRGIEKQWELDMTDHMERKHWHQIFPSSGCMLNKFLRVKFQKRKELKK